MLLRQIKSESYGVLRYKPFRPSLSAKKLGNLLNVSGFLNFLLCYPQNYPQKMVILGGSRIIIPLTPI